MKEISEYTLKECLEEVEMLHGGYGFRDPEKLADRIADLTRWIPVSERMPTDDDADQFGEVLGTNDGAYAVVLRYYDFSAREDITHWQRITSPEGNP